MATMHLTGATVSIGGVALTSVTDVELPIETEPSDSGWATDRLAALGDFSATFTGYWDGPMPLLDLPVERTISVYVPWSVARRWLAAHERQRARVRRMHAAYRRRKRGQW